MADPQGLHTHPDVARLTFGCPGCILRAKSERWASAPERIVHCRAAVPGYVARHADGKQVAWDYTTRQHVPDGATLAEVEEHTIYADDCACDMPEYPGLTYLQRVEAIAMARCRVVRIESAAPTHPQPPLFGVV